MKMNVSDETCGRLLFFRRDGQAGTPYQLCCGKTTIGSSTDADIRLKLNNSNLEPIHCIIDVNEDGIAIILNKSVTAPVKVNNISVRKIKALKHEDKIELVGKQFLYLNEKISEEDVERHQTFIKQAIFTPSKKRQSVAPLMKSAKKTPNVGTKISTRRRISMRKSFASSSTEFKTLDAETCDRRNTIEKSKTTSKLVSKTLDSPRTSKRLSLGNNSKYSCRNPTVSARNILLSQHGVSSTVIEEDEIAPTKPSLSMKNLDVYVSENTGFLDESNISLECQLENSSRSKIYLKTPSRSSIKITVAETRRQEDNEEYRKSGLIENMEMSDDSSEDSLYLHLSQSPEQVYNEYLEKGASAEVGENSLTGSRRSSSSSSDLSEEEQYLEKKPLKRSTRRSHEPSSGVRRDSVVVKAHSKANNTISEISVEGRSSPRKSLGAPEERKSSSRRGSGASDVQSNTNESLANSLVKRSVSRRRSSIRKTVNTEQDSITSVENQPIEEDIYRSPEQVYNESFEQSASTDVGEKSLAGSRRSSSSSSDQSEEEQYLEKKPLKRLSTRRSHEPSSGVRRNSVVVKAHSKANNTISEISVEGRSSFRKSLGGASQIQANTTESLVNSLTKRTASRRRSSIRKSVNTEQDSITSIEKEVLQLSREDESVYSMATPDDRGTPKLAYSSLKKSHLSEEEDNESDMSTNEISRSRSKHTPLNKSSKTSLSSSIENISVITVGDSVDCTPENNTSVIILDTPLEKTRKSTRKKLSKTLNFTIQDEAESSTPKSAIRSRRSKSLPYNPITEDVTPADPLDKSKSDSGFKTPLNTPRLFENIRKSVMKSRSQTRRSSSNLTEVSSKEEPKTKTVKRARESSDSSTTKRTKRRRVMEAQCDDSVVKDSEGIDSSFESFRTEDILSDISDQDLSQNTPKYFSDLTDKPVVNVPKTRSLTDPRKIKCAPQRRSLHAMKLENHITTRNRDISCASISSDQTDSVFEGSDVSSRRSSSSTDTLPKRIQKSPKNDLTNVPNLRRLMSPKPANSPKNDIDNIVVFKQMFATPKQQKSPKNDLTKIPNLRRLMSPKNQRSPKNDLSDVAGLKKLLSVPEQMKSPENDLRKVPNLRRLMSPKNRNSPVNDLSNITGVKKLLSTPTTQNSPRNDLTNIPNLRRIMSPRQQTSPRNDLTEVRGLKRLMKTPRKQKEPVNDLSNVENVASIFNVSGVHRLSNESDIENNEDLFDKLFAKRPLKTYRGRSLSPTTRKSMLYGKHRKTQGDTPVTSPRVEKWVEEQAVIKAQNDNNESEQETRDTTRRLVEKSRDSKKDKMEVEEVEQKSVNAPKRTLRKRNNIKTLGENLEDNVESQTSPRLTRGRRKNINKKDDGIQLPRPKPDMEDKQLKSTPVILLEEMSLKERKRRNIRCIDENVVDEPEEVVPVRGKRARNKKEEGSMETPVVEEPIKRTRRQRGVPEAKQQIIETSEDAEKDENQPARTRGTRRGAKQVVELEETEALDNSPKVTKKSTRGKKQAPAKVPLKDDDNKADSQSVRVPRQRNQPTEEKEEIKAKSTRTRKKATVVEETIVIDSPRSTRAKRGNFQKYGSDFVSDSPKIRTTTKRVHFVETDVPDEGGDNRKRAGRAVAEFEELKPTTRRSKRTRK